MFLILFTNLLRQFKSICTMNKLVLQITMGEAGLSDFFLGCPEALENLC